MYNNQFFIQQLVLKLVMLFFLFGLFATSCAIQKTISSDPEEQSVRQTIEMYFDGWSTGDTLKIGKAMHTTCKLKNIKEDDVIVYDREKYLSFFKPRPKLKNIETRIVSINITGDIGAAKCEIETPERLSTDYFNLMKVNDQWYIVDKIATSVVKK